MLVSKPDVILSHKLMFESLLHLSCTYIVIWRHFPLLCRNHGVLKLIPCTVYTHKINSLDLFQILTFSPAAEFNSSLNGKVHRAFPSNKQHSGIRISLFFNIDISAGVTLLWLSALLSDLI